MYQIKCNFSHEEFFDTVGCGTFVEQSLRHPETDKNALDVVSHLETPF